MTLTGITAIKSIIDHWHPEEPSSEFLADHWSKRPNAGEDSSASSGATADEDSSSSTTESTAD